MTEVSTPVIVAAIASVSLLQTGLASACGCSQQGASELGGMVRTAGGGLVLPLGVAWVLSVMAEGARERAEGDTGGLPIQFGHDCAFACMSWLIH